jgi:hypothetical protein
MSLFVFAWLVALVAVLAWLWRRTVAARRQGLPGARRGSGARPASTATASSDVDAFDVGMPDLPVFDGGGASFGDGGGCDAGSVDAGSCSSSGD